MICATKFKWSVKQNLKYFYLIPTLSSYGLLKIFEIAIGWNNFKQTYHVVSKHRFNGNFKVLPNKFLVFVNKILYRKGKNYLVKPQFHIQETWNNIYS